VAPGREVGARDHGEGRRYARHQEDAEGRHHHHARAHPLGDDRDETGPEHDPVQGRPGRDGGHTQPAPPELRATGQEQEVAAPPPPGWPRSARRLGQLRTGVVPCDWRTSSFPLSRSITHVAATTASMANSSTAARCRRQEGRQGIHAGVEAPSGSRAAPTTMSHRKARRATSSVHGTERFSTYREKHPEEDDTDDGEQEDGRHDLERLVSPLEAAVDRLAHEARSPVAMRPPRRASGAPDGRRAGAGRATRGARRRPRGAGIGATRCPGPARPPHC
jgi:hypothetical protein